MMKKKFLPVRIKVGFPFFALTAFFLSGELWLNYLYALLFSFLHETGHLLPMLCFNSPPDSVTFGVSGIKICKKELSLSPLQECVTALGGPLVNIFMMLLFSSNRESLPFMINTGLAVFNLLPLKSLDGGRFIYNFLLHFRDNDKAVRVLFYMETATLVFLILLLVFSLIKGFTNTTFILFVIMLVLTTLTDMFKG